MSEKVAVILTVILAIVILVGGIVTIIYESLNLDFNDGKCQVCGENVIPVGHQYTTDYYCPNCQRYNKG
jgi:hypothetical protein